MLRVEDFFEVRACTEGDVWRLGLAGELDLASAEVLMWEVRHLPSTDHRSMIVDLRFLEFADVAGIRALLDACACLCECCCDVSLEHASLGSDGARGLVRGGRLAPFAD
jgi:anti-anti-sigma factor